MKANSVRPMLPFFPFQNFPFLPTMPDNLPHHPPPHHLLPQSPPFGYHNANSKLTSGSPSPSSPPYGFHHGNPKLSSGSPPPSSPPYAYQGGKMASGSPTPSSPPYGYRGSKVASGSPTPSSPPFGYRGSKVASGSPTRSSPPSSPPYSDGPEELEHNRDRHTGMLPKIPCCITLLRYIGIPAICMVQHSRKLLITIRPFNCLKTSIFLSFCFFRSQTKIVSLVRQKAIFFYIL
jgi:hypothetical protein